MALKKPLPATLPPTRSEPEEISPAVSSLTPLRPARVNAQRSKQRPWNGGLQAKIIVPYVLLSLLVGGAASYIFTSVLLATWTERFNAQLFSAADEAADTVVSLESSQLNQWRQIAYTEGVSAAAGRHDPAELDRLIKPLALANQIESIWLLSTPGTGIWQWPAGQIPADPQWPIVQKIQADGKNRFVTIQTAGAEIYLLTGGALINGAGETTGILLIGTTLDQVAQQVERAVLAEITFYGEEGQLWASTFGLTDPSAVALTPTEANSILAAQETTPIREIEAADDEYVQVLLPFELQAGQDVGVMGVSLPREFFVAPLYPARQSLMAIFTAVVAGIIIIGYGLAWHITRPLAHLVAAANQVAAGDLEIVVPVRSTDEIGHLTDRFNHMVEQLRWRRYMESLFGHYVGDEIARRILADGAELGGSKVWATVLFADIRNFTTFVESANLNEMIDELNEYYGLMQAAIEAHGGVVNKFGGDSLLALFGAPLPQADHADQAVRTALEMVSQLRILNQRRQRRGQNLFHIGIGVNTGEMIAGNLGARQRREYTVLGDSVNIASRLSDLNKTGSNHTVFISHTTIMALKNIPRQQFIYLEDCSLKGKQQKVPVYTLQRDIEKSSRR